MIVGFEELGAIREKHAKETIVLAGGVFDIIHEGHQDLFQRMQLAGDVGVIALTTDKRTKERKGPKRPIREETSRLIVVDGQKGIDYSVLAPEPAPSKEVPTLQVVRALRPDVLISCEEAQWQDYQNKLAESGTELIVIPRYRIDISTSAIIDRVLELYCEDR